MRNTDKGRYHENEENQGARNKITLPIRLINNLEVPPPAHRPLPFPVRNIFLPQRRAVSSPAHSTKEPIIRESGIESIDKTRDILISAFGDGEGVFSDLQGLWGEVWCRHYGCGGGWGQGAEAKIYTSRNFKELKTRHWAQRLDSGKLENK